MTMNSLAGFGDILQIAYVPQDFDADLDYWIKLGAGPFYTRRAYTLKECFFMGEPVTVTMDLALGYWGHIQLELIHQLSSDPSAYRAWQDEGRTGVHHIGFMTDDIAGAKAKTRSLGLDIVQETRGKGQETFYAWRPDKRETTLEYIELSDRRRDLCAMQLEAHRTWDGSDPIREG